MVRLWEVESVAYPMLVLILSVQYMLSFSLLQSSACTSHLGISEQRA